MLDEDLLVGENGGMKNVFVRVHARRTEDATIRCPTSPPCSIKRAACFDPRVQGVRVGQKLLVDNGDPVTHNVRSFPVLNPAFNFGQPPDTEPRERVFEKAEREIEIQCDFHLWMHAYVFVMDHPFYGVSADDGTYAIDRPAAGRIHAGSLARKARQAAAERHRRRQGRGRRDLHVFQVGAHEPHSRISR